MLFSAKEDAEDARGRIADAASSKVTNMLRDENQQLAQGFDNQSRRVAELDHQVMELKAKKMNAEQRRGDAEQVRCSSDSAHCWFACSGEWHGGERAQREEMGRAETLAPLRWAHQPCRSAPVSRTKCRPTPVRRGAGSHTQSHGRSVVGVKCTLLRARRTRVLIGACNPLMHRLAQRGVCGVQALRTAQIELSTTQRDNHRLQAQVNLLQADILAREEKRMRRFNAVALPIKIALCREENAISVSNSEMYAMAESEGVPSAEWPAYVRSKLLAP